MKKQYTSAEVFTTENFNNPFGDNHHSPTYNLSEYFKSIFSQHGEDGILEYLYSIIDLKKKYYVEFGASNGNTIENTRSLRVNHGWSGLLMEGDKELVNQSKGLVNNEWITSENIMELFSKYEVPNDFDFLSIDIDSDDIYVFDEIDTEKYKPSVIIGEYNPGLPNHLPLSIEKGKSDYGINHHPQNQNFPCYHGCNIHAWYVVAKRKGYSILTTCGVNVVMVRDDYASNFVVPPLKDIVTEPYFRKERNRFEFQSRLNDNFKWILIE
tara:strand:+ start:1403 stop:2206 length:804 start_codon:yes stop_codon:yes gene_type:complete